MGTRWYRRVALAAIAFVVLGAAPAWAFTVTRAESDATGTFPTRTGTLPSSVAAGELLIACFSGDTNLTAGVSWEMGWTELYDAADGSLISFGSCAYKFAAGGETTVSLTASGSEDDCVFTTFRIQGAHASQAPEDGTPEVTSGTTTPDPPSVTASWGAEANLFIIALAHTADATVSAYPTNYSTNGSLYAHAGTRPRLVTSWREATAATEDPGTFTLSNNDATVVNTIVVRPAAATATGSMMLMGIGD